MAGKLRIKSFKQLYILFLITALIAATALILFRRPSLQPFALNLLDKQFTHNIWNILYHDFDQDGYSEAIEVKNDPALPSHHLIFYDYREGHRPGDIIDQFDFSEPVHAYRLFFHDFSGDGYDEAVVFSQAEDSLFLSVIDVRRRAWMLRRHPLLQRDHTGHFHRWDTGAVFCRFLDVNRDGHPEIVFTLHSGKSLQPRGVYIFDVYGKAFLAGKTMNAGIMDLLLYDLSGDGQEEIIVVGRATGNIPEGPYSDYSNWLFVFDQNLEPLFRPRNFAEYPGNMIVRPVQVEGRPHLLIATSYQGTRPLSNELHLMNSEGLLVKSKKLPYKGAGTLHVDSDRDPLRFFLKFNPGPLHAYDIHFNRIAEGNFALNANIWALIDLDHDGQKEIILHMSNTLQVVSQDLRLLASYRDEDDKITGVFSFRRNGKQKPVDIAFHTPNYYQLLAFEKNMTYRLLPLIFAASALGIFLVQILFFRIFRYVYIYVSYFLFSLKKSSNGLLILNHNGKITYVNSAVQKLLNLPQQLAAGMYYRDAFAARAEIVQGVSESIDSALPLTNELTITQKDHQFKGEVTVTPFVSPIGPVFAYLVEIRDYTAPLMSDRLKSWTSSVQKMAHEIKQPLSSISLNLKALQRRLENVPLGQSAEIKEDIQVMKSELDRVRLLTNSFLKFVNLDHPNRQQVEMGAFLRESLKRYDPYAGRDFRISLEIDDHLPGIAIDARQMEMAIHTLVENAIDALKGRGLIQITVMLAQYLDRSFADYIQIEIADNGPGIPSDIKDKIFEPFFTTKETGTGMGLAIARKIIEDHRGFIEINGEGKLGTTVRLAIPVLE